MATLVDLLSNTYAPIQRAMLPYFDIVDILALGRTCMRLKTEIPPALTATRYNINRHLEKFFNDPVEFRSLLGSYGGLVYGDFARCFLAGDTSKVTELHIAAENPINFYGYLIKEGYSDYTRLGRKLGIRVWYCKILPETSHTLLICLDCANGHAAIAKVFESFGQRHVVTSSRGTKLSRSSQGQLTSRKNAILLTIHSRIMRSAEF